MSENDKIIQICGHFRLEGSVSEYTAFGNGHINDTYRITCSTARGPVRYILQRLNTDIFQHPDQVMENIWHVTQWLKKKVSAMGGDPDREVLTIVPAADDQMGFHYQEEYWRMYRFIEGAAAYEQARDEKIFSGSAFAFGQFQRLLADFPADLLHETIPDFHHTPRRLEAFEEAVRRDRVGRNSLAAKEIEFLNEHRDLADMLQSRLEKGVLPLRVTHNDTKLNNIMMDCRTGEPVCVIDLDTVMPGLSATDF